MKRFLKSPMFSPAGFLLRAAVIALVYAVVTLAGLRSYTSVISLTYPEGVSKDLANFWCFLYLLCHFAFVLGVPILLLGAGILRILSRYASGTPSSGSPGRPQEGS